MYINILIQLKFCSISNADALKINVLNRVHISVSMLQDLKLCGKAVTPNTSCFHKLHLHIYIFTKSLIFSKNKFRLIQKLKNSELIRLKGNELTIVTS